MTERVEPSANEQADNYKLALAISNGLGAGWIVPSDTDIHASDDGASDTPLNAFEESHSGSSLDVTIDTGEAFVGGKYCWIDSQTTVTLPASSTTIVYLALPTNAGNDVRIDHKNGSDYPSEPNNRLELWEFVTDGSGVTSATNKRALGQTLTVDDDGRIQAQGRINMNGEPIKNLGSTGNDAVGSPQGSTVYAQDSEPSSPDDDDIWIDTS